jgi:ATP-dependent Lhr-like helicase
VVIADGELVLYLDRGRRVLSFATSEPALSADAMRRAAAALRQLFAQRRRRNLRIDEIDGEPATRSRFSESFTAAGFRADYKGLVLERSEALAKR